MKTFAPKSFSILTILLIGITINLFSQTVYVTKTGSKYHKSDCRYLQSNKIETTIPKAKTDGLSACKVCKPSATTTSTTSETTAPMEKTSEVKTKTKTSTTNKITATRYTATTKSGTRCKRTITDPSGKYWQHK